MRSKLEIYSRLTFLIIGSFHFSFNWYIFELNYIRGTYRWIMNINAIGEADIEAIIMLILLFPFLLGAWYHIKDFKKIIDEV